MDSALGWIGEIAAWIGQFFPRLEIVRSTHGMIKFVRGYKVKEKGPGLHFWWPLTTDVTVYPIARQTVDLRGQRFTTTDGRTIAASGLLVYEVEDLTALIGQTDDPDQTVIDISLAAVIQTLSILSWAEIQQYRVSTKLDTRLKKKANRGLRPYGVEVIQATLTDLAPTTVLTLLHGGEGGRQSFDES